MRGQEKKRMRRGRLVAALAIGFAWAAPVCADEAAKQADIKRYLDLVGVGTTLNRMVGPLTDQYMETFRRVQPNATDEAQQAMQAILAREFGEGMPALIDQIAQVYARVFSEEEVAALVAFQQSPAGRKLQQATPQLQREMAATAMEWGRGVAEKSGTLFLETYKPKE